MSIKRILFTLSLLLTVTGQALAVGSSFDVSVIDSVNDGSVPAGCSINSGAGGIAEVSLDLDEDGIADLCIGGGDPPANCSADFNLDCSSVAGGSLCSAEEDSVNSTFMAGDFSYSSRFGDQVGPTFVAETGSVDGPFGDTLLAVGFSGASSNPGLLGYFIMRINGADCSLGFGRAIFDNGDGVLAYGDRPTFTVNSVGDAPDSSNADGICSTGTILRSGINECTLRAAIEQANSLGFPSTIAFDFLAGQCDANDLCVIDIDSANAPLPPINSTVDIDGTTYAPNAGVCDSAINNRQDYKVVINGNGGNAGLLFDFMSDGSSVRGLNIRGFSDNIRLLGSSFNTIACNFIGTDETGMIANPNNAFTGISLLCDSENNTIGGPNAEDGNLISGHTQADGIRLFAGLNCAPNGGDLPANNEILGNYIGTAKNGITPLGNGLDGISIFGGASSNNYIGVSSDMTTLNGNVIAANDSAGIFIDNGANSNTIMGNYVGTDISGSANLGNGFGGVDLFETSDNTIGGTDPGQGNVITNNLDGVFASTTNNLRNSIRGNSMYGNQGLAIELVTDGGDDADGQNPNDTDDADTGANQLMNYPDIVSAGFSSVPFAFTSVNFSVDATEANASYPLTIDAYFSEQDEPMQGRTYLGSVTYATAQASVIETFTLPAGSTGGLIALTATSADGNTSELSPAVMIGTFDIIFKNGFE